MSLFKKNIDNWKIKAKEKSSEIKKLKKVIKELSRSRDKWKGKANIIKKKNDILEEELKKNY